MCWREQRIIMKNRFLLPTYVVVFVHANKVNQRDFSFLFCFLYYFSILFLLLQRMSTSSPNSNHCFWRSYCFHPFHYRNHLEFSTYNRYPSDKQKIHWSRLGLSGLTASRYSLQTTPTADYDQTYIYIIDFIQMQDAAQFPSHTVTMIFELAQLSETCAVWMLCNKVTTSVRFTFQRSYITCRYRFTICRQVVATGVLTLRQGLFVISSFVCEALCSSAPPLSYRKHH